MERLENEESYIQCSRAHSPIFPSLYLHHSSFSNFSITSPMSQLILKPFHCFTYVTAHSPTLPSISQRHSSFSNPSVTSPTSQLILQPFFRFSYFTGFSLTSPGEPPIGETRCQLIACSSRKAPRGPPGLPSPSDGRIAINSIIRLLNIYTSEGFGI